MFIQAFELLAGFLYWILDTWKNLLENYYRNLAEGVRHLSCDGVASEDFQHDLFDLHQLLFHSVRHEFPPH